MACCGGAAGSEKFAELTASLPVTVRTPAEVPAIQIAAGHSGKLLGCVVSELDPNFVHQPLHIKGPPSHYFPVGCKHVASRSGAPCDACCKIPSCGATPSQCRRDTACIAGAPTPYAGHGQRIDRLITRLRT